jgi:TonB family protein
VKNGFGPLASAFVLLPGLLFAQSTTPTKMDLSSKASSTPVESERTAYVTGFKIRNRSSAELAGDYADHVLRAVRREWYAKIQPQKSTELQRRMTIVEFEIRGDGSLAKVRVVKRSGSDSLDEIARQAISSSAPFDRVPAASRKQLKLRMYFGYNQPTTANAPICDGANMGAHSTHKLHQVGNGVEAPHPIYTPDPEFSEEARKAQHESEVVIVGTVDEQGFFTDLCILQPAGAGLDEKAIKAASVWKFQPATHEGQPVAVRISVDTTFRLY